MTTPLADQIPKCGDAMKGAALVNALVAAGTLAVRFGAIVHQQQQQRIAP